MGRPKLHVTAEEKKAARKIIVNRWNANHPQHVTKWRHKQLTAQPSYIFMTEARRRARLKSLPFDIEDSDIIIPEFCPVLGIKLEHAKGQHGPSDNSPTLDRFIPELGYVRGNIAIISYKANRLKSNGTTEEIVKLANWMVLQNKVGTVEA